MSGKPIQVFEHGILKVDENSAFKNRHWKSLGWYNETHGGRFFTLTPNGVKFNQFVGVIQLDELTIEILPKIGKQAEIGQEDKWKNVLLEMLQECHWMKVHAHEKASLKLKYNSILEAYLELFVIECEYICRQGLIKKYRSRDGNCKALKGKLLFGKNIQYNLIHQENFYTRHQVFDQDHLLNQILLKALKLIARISKSPLLKDRVLRLIMDFPELSDIQVTENTFEKIVYNRKSETYREAIQIAAMLLLNYRPDISGGRNDLLAILFDMNELWEEYIYRQLFRHKEKGWIIQNQTQKRFWHNDSGKSFKLIKPDIVIKLKEGFPIIIDTKWKLPDSTNPADSDLKQMFAYNELWKSQTAVLLYPTIMFSKDPEFKPGHFKKEGNILHRCGMLKISVLDEDGKRLDPQLGKRLAKFIEQETERCKKVFPISS